MKKFKKFLEEFDIKGHSGIPGEGGKRSGEQDYLANVTLRAKTRLGIQNSREGDHRAIGASIQTLMSNADQLARLSRGHEDELEKLATDIITSVYGHIIEAYEIKLDIKLSTPDQMDTEQRNKNFWEKSRVKQYTEADKNKKPVIRARGLDFSMLIHEAVKGIWFVLSSGAIPKDPKLAADIKKAITYEDEPEDWRYGPEIAADLRDFVNKNPKVQSYPNIREELWKEMCDEDTIPTDEFIELFRGILSNTKEARKKIDDMIDNIATRLDKWNKEMEEYKIQLAKWEEWERNQKNKPVVKNEPKEEPKEEDPDAFYNNMSKRELDSELNTALDNGDYDLATKINDIINKKFNK